MLLNFINIVILSIVEALTEFLPVSSTAHLLFFLNFLGLKEIPVFNASIIIMQLGSILAVCFIYKKILFPANLSQDELKKFLNIYFKIGMAFIPTGICGFLFYKTIKQIFFVSNIPSAILLIIGGLFLIKDYSKMESKKYTLQNIPFKTMFIIGLFQALSIFPGVSRSGATIIGGILLGLEIKTAIEISFFLALPTILAATIYEIIFGNFFDANGNAISILNILSDTNNLYIIISGFCLSFIFAIIIIPSILKFTQKNGFRIFGIYRIIIGIIIIILQFI